MTNKSLELDLRLLVLRYGRRPVMQALAEIGEQTLEDVERQLAAAEARKASRKSAPKPTADLVAEACGDRPEIAENLRTIVARFENRCFLPKLRDVERFLARVGFAHGQLKSRPKAVGHLVKALSQLDANELRRLVALTSAQGESDYALLAREIMGGDKTRDQPPSKPPSQGSANS